jgi:hypothetical protein
MSLFRRLDRIKAALRQAHAFGPVSRVPATSSETTLCSGAVTKSRRKSVSFYSLTLHRNVTLPRSQIVAQTRDSITIPTWLAREKGLA